MTRLLRYTLFLSVLALVRIGALSVTLPPRNPASQLHGNATDAAGQALKVMTWNVQDPRGSVTCSGLPPPRPRGTMKRRHRKTWPSASTKWRG